MHKAVINKRLNDCFLKFVIEITVKILSTSPFLTFGCRVFDMQNVCQNSKQSDQDLRCFSIVVN